MTQAGSSSDDATRKALLHMSRGLAILLLAVYIRNHVGQPAPPTTLAKAQAIDLSVQFTYTILVLLVLLGWWTSDPMSLLFGAPQS